MFSFSKFFLLILVFGCSSPNLTENHRGQYNERSKDEFLISSERGTSLDDFDTSGLKFWENYGTREGGVTDSSKKRTFRLSFIDITYDDDDTTGRGVGYDFSDQDRFVHPEDLAENYIAFFLCYNWNDDDNEVDYIYENIPPAAIHNAEDFFGAEFETSSTEIYGADGINRCIIEITSKNDPFRVIYKQKHLVKGNQNGQFYLNQIDDETLIVANKPILETYSTPTFDLDKVVQEDLTSDAISNLINQEPNVRYLLMSSIGERSGSRPNRQVTYSLSCRNEDGGSTNCYRNNSGEIVTNEADEEENQIAINIANTPALFTKDDFCLGSSCTLSLEKPFEGDHFGQIPATELYTLKSMEAAFVQLDGTKYLLNTCIKDEDENYKCQYDKNMAATIAEKYAGLTKQAKRFVVWKKVRKWLITAAAAIVAIGLGVVAWQASAFVSLLGALGVVSSATAISVASTVASSLATLWSLINSISFTVASASIAIVGAASSLPTYIVDLRNCTNQECRTSIITDMALIASDSVLEVANPALLATEFTKAFKTMEAFLPSIPSTYHGSFISSAKIYTLHKGYDLNDIVIGNGNWSDARSGARKDLLNALSKLDSDVFTNPENTQFISGFLRPSTKLSTGDVYAKIELLNEQFPKKGSIFNRIGGLVDKLIVANWELPSAEELNITYFEQPVSSLSYYEGEVLFRGDVRNSADHYFKNGWRSTGNNVDLDDIQHNSADSAFVATSKNKQTALNFAEQKGYFIIDNTTARGVDINETLIAQGDRPTRELLEEVSMPGGILPIEIIGYYDLTTDSFTSNPNYSGTLIPKDVWFPLSSVSISR